MGLGDTSPEYSNPTVTRGWQHAATLPRELSFNGQRLIQQPLPEYQKLRGKPFFWNVELKDSFTAPKLAGEVYELQVELTQQTKNCSFSCAKTRFSYDGHIFTLSHGPSGYGRKKSIQLSELRQIQLFMDTSSMEVFINNGSIPLLPDFIRKRARPNRLLRDWQFGYSTVAILKLANSMRNQQRSVIEGKERVYSRCIDRINCLRFASLMR